MLIILGWGIIYLAVFADITTKPSLCQHRLFHRYYSPDIFNIFMIHTVHTTYTAQEIVIRYITAQLLGQALAEQSFTIIISRREWCCMSIQMVPGEETELHREHSHSIIVSLEVWLAWDGRWMISCLEYIYIHKQTPQNRISIKSNKEKEEKINVSGKLSVFPMALMIFKSSKDYFSCNLSYTKL